MLEHGISSYGFRIVEKDKPGELLVDKLKKIGIRPGPIYRHIKENQTTTLEDGRVIKRHAFIGKSKPGRIICIFGDTRNALTQSDFVNHADLLIHEATFEHNKKELAQKYFHSTTTEVAELAKYSQVKQLILTHISSRYQKDDLPRLLEEAQRIFPNTKLANDFKHFSVAPKRG